MKRTVHAVAGGVAITTVASFMTSTLVAELTGNHSLIVAVKRFILFGLGVLIPAMAIAGGTGNSLSANRKGRLIDAKRRRMKFIAANGLLILVPSALVLYRLASAGSFGVTFVVIQIIELAAGATNVFLLSRMIRDGFRLSGRFRPART
ncbi:hypothetical protein [Polyangium jinanense]|uniref:Uncharacterized protein n=1 Tax=Polyangium jinanense TaxID=2829994 RepID=A0A9X3XH59_9BACT|nr:hypothetical protein [Polyangium jinanense]MDC3962398.1 hypothetical protein [Polyangium jinanense]MDC3989290.1 hypothetical protein [Polyangium jinanense]